MTTDTVELTERQYKIFEYIRKSMDTGHNPSVREIAAEFGLRSLNGVTCHLNALIKKGVVEKDPNKSRSLRIVGYTAMLVTPEERRELLKQRRKNR